MNINQDQELTDKEKIALTWSIIEKYNADLLKKKCKEIFPSIYEKYKP